MFFHFFLSYIQTRSIRVCPLQISALLYILSSPEPATGSFFRTHGVLKTVHLYKWTVWYLHKPILLLFDHSLRLAPSYNGVAAVSQILCISTALNKRKFAFIKLFLIRLRLYSIFPVLSIDIYKKMYHLAYF